MLILRGAPALSEFRIQKFIDQCAKAALPVSSIYAEFVHFADLTAALSEEQQNVLGKLLTYGPTITSHQPTGTLLVVTPRPGTISPWSSKATDIAHNCGLTQIKRLERGLAYYVNTSRVLTADEQQQLAGLLHDRMMETVLTAQEQAKP